MRRMEAATLAALADAAQLVRVAHRVDARDAAALDREREQREIAVGAEEHQAEPAVDLDQPRRRLERGLAAQGEPPARDALGAADRLERGDRAAAAVGCPHDVGIERGGEALEVALDDRARERPDRALVLVRRGVEARALLRDV